MADEIRTTETKTETGGSSTMAFILGGVVIAVAVIAWLVFGGGMSGPKGASDDAAKTSITIDNTTPAVQPPAAAAPATPAPATTAPATPAPATPAPATPAPAAPAP
jgi:type IV secretory pathway VirB10-like protein